jgi:hypothetical protein
MSKYTPLGDFLRAQDTELVAMRFDDIERVVGTKLPAKSQRHRPWWSNNPNNNVMTKVWLDAGFRTEQVDMEGRRLVFRRVGPARNKPAPSVSGGANGPGPDRGPRHPLFGALKGLVKVMPGTDLTKPADPTWGDK